MSIPDFYAYLAEVNQGDVRVDLITVSESSLGEQNEDGLSTGNLSCLSRLECSSTTIIFAAISMYAIFTIVRQLIHFYNFIVEWNLVFSERRFDMLEFYKKRRRMTYKETLKLQIRPPCLKSNTCTICLSDFYKTDIVTSCDEGCQNWFHKECLFEWLDRSVNCPCCRRDMLSRKPRGFFVELSISMGFPPTTR